MGWSSDRAGYEFVSGPLSVDSASSSPLTTDNGQRLCIAIHARSPSLPITETLRVGRYVGSVQSLSVSEPSRRALFDVLQPRAAQPRVRVLLRAIPAMPGVPGTAGGAPGSANDRIVRWVKPSGPDRAPPPIQAARGRSFGRCCFTWPLSAAWPTTRPS